MALNTSHQHHPFLCRLKQFRIINKGAFSVVQISVLQFNLENNQLPGATKIASKQD